MSSGTAVDITLQIQEYLKAAYVATSGGNNTLRWVSDPPNKITTWPLAVVYMGNGGFVFGDPMGRISATHNLLLRIIWPVKNITNEIEQSAPWIDEVPKLLYTKFIEDRWGGLVDALDSQGSFHITYNTTDQSRWGDIPTFEVQFLVSGIRTERSNPTE